MGLIVNYETVGSIPFEHLSQQIENQVYEQYYKTELSRVRDHPLIEDDYNHGVPHMNEVFYQIYSDMKVIPSWGTFRDTYWGKYVIENPNKGRLDEQGNLDPLWIGDYSIRHKKFKYQYGFDEPPMLKKLLRTYMSFLKEQHVMHWFYDKGLTTAYWSSDADNRLGIDIMLTNPFGRQYGIKVYSKTRRAKNFAAIKKNSRHAATKGISTIAIPVPMNGPKLGDTFVVPDHILMCAYNLIMHDIETVTITNNPDGSAFIEPGIILEV